MPFSSFESSLVFCVVLITLLLFITLSITASGYKIFAINLCSLVFIAVVIIYVLAKEEGGRHTPFFKNYRPQFYFRSTDVTGEIELPAGKEMVMPGDNTKIIVKLIAPVAMDEGLRFAIREGGRTVGAGVVSKIIK